MRLDVKAGGASIGRLWTGVALFLLNMVVLFVVLNAAAYGLQRALRPGPRELGRTAARYGIDRVAAAYPGWRRADLLELLQESERAFENEYEPFTEFRPKPLRGRYFNVSPAGFRNVGQQGPWPPNPAAFNVFVFGGSTVFGVGAPDEQTIPSYLGETLAQADCATPVRVYNFGRPAYYSTQERILFEQLLAGDRVPRLAVFVDGLNEFYIWPRPLAADVLRVALEGTFRRGARERLLELIDAFPLVDAARALRARLRDERPADPALGRPEPQAAVGAWEVNRRLIEQMAGAHGVATLFVWQPVPCYRYDLRYHLFYDDAGFARLTPERIRRGYALVEARQASLGDNFLWLGALQEGWTENLYVTDMHYRPLLSKAIADRIAHHLLERGVLRCGAAGP